MHPLRNRLFFALKISHVAHNHHGDLKGQRIIEFPHIKSTALFKLLNPIDKSVSVYKELSGSLRHVEVILKEHVYGV